MLIITNLENKSLPLSDVIEFKRFKATTGEMRIELNVNRTNKNKVAFNLIEDYGKITINNESYTIFNINKKTINETVNIEVSALHSFYDNSANFRHDKILGEKVLSLHEALTFAFKDTNITFIIENREQFSKESFEDFGEENSIVLFQKLKDKFEFEFEIENNNHLIIKKKLGSKTGQQLRWKHNIVTISQSSNVEQLTTYIKGFGAPKLDKENEIIEGEYLIKGDYTSPNIKKYGKIEADPYFNEKITHKDTLIKYLKSKVIDEPEFLVEIAYKQLQNNVETQLKDLKLGDVIILIHEKMNLKFEIRINQIEDFPLLKDNKPNFTLSTKPLNLIDKETLAIVDKKHNDKLINNLHGKNTTLQNRIENAVESINAIDNKMIDVNKELKKLEKETTQNIEQAIKDTTIPQQVEAPFPIPNSNLWWDTSIDPMRLKRWDGENWVALALEDEEIDDLMNQMIDDVVVNNKVYTDKEIKAVSDILSNELNKKVDSTIYNKKVGELDVSINSINGKVSNVETTIDKHTGEINKAKSDIGALEVRSDSINANVSSLSGEVDNVNNKIDNISYSERNLVLKSNIPIVSNTYRITSYDLSTDWVIGETWTIVIKGTLNKSQNFGIWANGSSSRVGITKHLGNNIHSTQINLSEYPNINGVNSGNKKLNLYNYPSNGAEESTIEWVKLVKGNIKTEDWMSAPEDTEVKFNTLTKNVADLDIKSDRIATTVSQVDTKVDGNTSIMNAMKTEIEQLPDQINLAVSEGIDDLEIGGVNLLKESSIINHTLGIQAVSIKNNPIKAGTYTLSFDYEVSNVGGQPTSFLIYSGKILFRVPLKKAGENRTSFTYTFTEDYGEDSLILYAGDFAGTSRVNEVTFYNLQLEKGNKATDWSLAEEDRVNKTNVLSSINLSKESIKIHAPKVDIHGLVSFINTDGTAGTMINGSKLITGSVTAKSLNANEIFGNSAIISKIQSDIVKTTKLSATQIDTGVLNANNVNIINLNANNIKTGTLDAIDIAGSSITGSTITGGTLTSAKSVIDFTTIESGKIRSEGEFTRTFAGGRRATYRAYTESFNGNYRSGLISKTANGETLNNITRWTVLSDKGLTTQQAVHSNSDDYNGARFIDFFADETLTSNVHGQGMHIYSGQDLLVESQFRTTITSGKDWYTHIEGAGLRVNANGMVLNLRRNTAFTPTVGVGGNYISIQSYDNAEHGILGITSNNYDLQLATTFGDFVKLRSRNGTHVRDQIGLTYKPLTASSLVATSSELDLMFGRVFNDKGITYIQGNSDIYATKYKSGQWVPLWAEEFNVRGVARIASLSGDTYVQGNLEVRTTKYNSGVYVPTRSSDFIKVSSIAHKSHFKEIDYSSLDIINDLNVIEYYLKDDLENRDYTNKQIGVISELSHEIASNDGKGISDYKHMSHLTRAVQELSEKDSNKENDIQTIYEVLEVIIKENEEMKIELQQLRS